MGLAASQARLLFITSRQNDVSAKMQRVSNQNMILARDSEEVSDKYNKMLASAESASSTSSSLVDSSTVNPTNLTYDAMMGAEGAGKYTSPYIISTSSGQVVLSSSMMNKLTALGGATSGSSSDFNAKYTNATSFIKAVAGEEVAAAYSSSNSGNDSFSVKTTMNDFLGKMTSVSGNRSTTTTEGKDDYFNTLANSNTMIGKDFGSSEGITAWYGADEKIDNYHRRNWRNGRVTNMTNTSRSISELYGLAGKKQGSIMLGSAARTTEKSLPALDGIKSNLSTLTNNIGSQLIKALTSLGFNADSAQSTVSSSVKKYYESYSNNIYWDEGTGDGDNYDKSSKWAEARKSAFNYVNNVADDKTYDSGWNDVFDDANQTYNENAVAIGMIASTGLHGIVATRCDSEGNNSWQFTLNLGNLVKDIIDDIFNTMSGGEIYETDYSGNTTVNTSKSVDLSIKTTKKTQTSEEKLLAQKADFYAKIYEQLASKGWVVDEDANDYSKLQEKIKNGTYTINGEDYKNNSNINEVAKTYTKEEAESYWKVEMAKIQRKEKLLDAELTKLQTEYSSLTTDYESVKSIISQNVSRSFTYCQNG